MEVVANESDYGMSAPVFGHDGNRALGVIMSIESGSVSFNRSTVQNEAQAPSGGSKNSGYGKFDRLAVWDEFTELKWISIDPSVQMYPT